MIHAHAEAGKNISFAAEKSIKNTRGYAGLDRCVPLIIH